MLYEIKESRVTFGDLYEYNHSNSLSYEYDGLLSACASRARWENVLLNMICELSV